MNKYLSIAPEIQEALAAGKPVVALESTILSHGMPYPENLEFSHRVEEIVREEGAVPATTAIICGKLCVGLTSDQLEIMCKAENVGKVSRPGRSDLCRNRHGRRYHRCYHHDAGRAGRHPLLRYRRHRRRSQRRGDYYGYLR